jgi:uncharacterized protein YxjI
MGRLRVHVVEADGLSLPGRKKVNAYVEMHLMGKMVRKTMPIKNCTHPIWNEVVQIDVDYVARLDLLVRQRTIAGRDVTIGSVFIDLTALPQGEEVRYSLDLPQSGKLSFSVCAVDFNPSAQVANGYLPFTAPVTFSLMKNYTLSRNSSRVTDLDVSQDVFDVRRMNILPNFSRNVSINDLTGTPLLHLKGKLKLGDHYYKVFFGGKGGPQIAALKERSGGNMTRLVVHAVPGTNLPAMMVLGRWQDRNFDFHSGSRVVATLRKAPRKSYHLKIAPGHDVVFIVACCNVLDKICQTNETAEKAATVAMVFLTVALFVVLI